MGWGHESAVSSRLAAAKLWLTSPPLANRQRSAPGRGKAPADDGGPRDLPYLTTALYALIPVASTNVDTMSADSHWRLYVNETWTTSASIPEIAAEMLHLVWHLLRGHAERAASMRVDASTADRWRLAADAALYATLSEDNLAPGGMLPPSILGLPDSLSAEQYFALLHEPASSARDSATGEGEPETSRAGEGQGPYEAPEREGCGSACDGLARTWELPARAGDANVDEDSARNIRRTVAIAYREHITSRGIEPGNAWRWTQEILEPTIAWQPVLAAAVRRAIAWTNGHTHYTYSRRSRRQSALPNILLPGTRRTVPTVAAVIDTSGSVDDTLLGRALGEVQGALTSLAVADANLTLLACDAAVHTVNRIRRAQDAKLAGGGGTDLRVGIRAVGELRPKPDVVIVLTDGYTPWPLVPPPRAAVIAVLLLRDGQTAPPTPKWSTRIECRL